jgi:hypothetical protein
MLGLVKGNKCVEMYEIPTGFSVGVAEFIM